MVDEYLNRSPAIEGEITAVREAVRGMSDISLAVLFGSAAVGRLRPDSDIDVAIAGDSPFSWERLQEIRIALSRKLRREVDLIDLSRARGMIVHQSLTKGIIVLSRNRRLLSRLMTEVVYFAADMLPMIRRSLQTQTRRFVLGRSAGRAKS